MTSGMIDTNDLLDAPADYAAEIKDPALRAKLLGVAKDPAYAFPARLWVQFAAAVPPVTPPNGSYRPYDYSNIGYIVAGMIAERVSGLSAVRRESRLGFGAQTPQGQSPERVDRASPS